MQGSGGLMALALFLLAVVGLMTIVGGAVTASQTGNSGYATVDGRLITDDSGTIFALENGYVSGGMQYWNNQSGSFLMHQVTYFQGDFTDGNGTVVYTKESGSRYAGGVSSTSWNDVTAGAWYAVMSGGLTALIVTAIATCVLLGVEVLGSSSSKDFTAKALVSSLLYGGLWALVSAFALSGFMSIPVFGGIVYLALMFAYFLGAWGIINGGSSY